MDAQLEVYYRNKPRYPEYADRVAIALKHGDKPCIGRECDEDHMCARHSRTIELTGRLFRMREVIGNIREMGLQKEKEDG